MLILWQTHLKKKALVAYLIGEKCYKQLINKSTTDYKTLIDQIYTNIPHQDSTSGTLESYYSDHKPIFVCYILEYFVD